MSRHTMLPWGALPVLVFAWAVQVQPASALLLEASAGLPESSLPGCLVAGSTPVACPTFNADFPAPFTGHASSFARAAPGDLGAAGSATLITENVDIAGSGTFVRVGGGSAQARYDDFIVTGPATLDGLVAATFNVALKGFFGAGASAEGSSAIGAEASALARLDTIAISHTTVPFGAVLSDDADGLILCEVAGGCAVESHLGSAFGEIGAADGAGTLTVNPGFPRGIIAEGMFSGATLGAFPIVLPGGFIGGAVDGIFTTPEFMLPIGQPLEMIYQFQTIASSAIASSGSGLGNAGAAINFSNSLEFPILGPVFNLPGGYTLNSISAQIAGNRWTGGTTPPIAVAVPEPPALPLLALGMLALAAFSGLRGSAGGKAGHARLRRARA